MTTFGWHHVFLSFGVVGLLLAWAWHKYVTDDPKDSPYVNEAELAHINEGRVEATGENRLLRGASCCVLPNSGLWVFSF